MQVLGKKKLISQVISVFVYLGQPILSNKFSRYDRFSVLPVLSVYVRTRNDVM